MEWVKKNLSDFISQDEAFYDMIFSSGKIMHFEPLTNRFLRLFRDVFKSEFDLKLNHLIVKDKGYEAVVLFFDHFYKKFFQENINYSKYSIEDQKRLYSLVDFIKENLDEDLNLDQLSRKVGFSKSKLQAMFHHFFHQSIYAFIKNIRLETAVELLKGTDHDIRMIAHNLGYNSSTHFINIFKKHYGLSPKRFRMEKLSKR
jgi:AraC-like DNA-binding protein